MHEQDFNLLRRQMVKDQIAARGVKDPMVLNAMSSVPREAFVPQKLRPFAYEDRPLPIGAQQTISQPFMVAFMIEALKLQGGERVLDVGTGSGYAAAVASKIAAEVYSIERIEQLAHRSKSTLKKLDYQNIHVCCGDGTQGLPNHAPYEAIMVAAVGIGVPEPLKSQLKIGGRLVLPVEDQSVGQRLIRLTRISETEYQKDSLGCVAFVPLLSGCTTDQA